VLDLEIPGSNARETITLECKRAVEDDGSVFIVLGCAGMADLCRFIADQVGVPVVDGVAAATKTVESLVAQGLATSTRSEYAAPPAKQYVGLLGQFTVGR
jgi:allantoin racemase